MYLAIKCNQQYLSNVCCAPQMKQNLLSVSRISDNGFNINFQNNCAKIYFQNTLTSVAKRSGNLYKLHCEVKLNNVLHRTISSNAAITTKEKWHRMLGHINFSDLNLLVNQKLATDLPEKLENQNLECEICVESKMVRPKFINQSTYSCKSCLRYSTHGFQRPY